MGDETKNGLLMIMIGTALSMGSTAVRIAGFMEGCLGGIGGLLVLLGILFLFLGRREISEVHARNVLIALALMIFAFIMMLMGTGMLVFSLMFGSTSSVMSWFYVLMVGGILAGLAYYFLLIELENDLGRKVLIAAVLVTIVAQIIVMTVTMGAVEDMIDTIEDARDQDWEDDEIADEVEDLQLDLARASAVTLAGQALILLAVFIPYDRIEKGELRTRHLVHRHMEPYGYNRYYPRRPEYPCSRCGYRLDWVERYQRWYCERCGRYE